MFNCQQNVYKLDNTKQNRTEILKSKWTLVNDSFMKWYKFQTSDCLVK